MHPVGGLLVRKTKAENADARGNGNLVSGSVKLLLDGQAENYFSLRHYSWQATKLFDGNTHSIPRTMY